MYVVETIILHYHIMQIGLSASATSVYHFSMPLVYPFCALFLCVLTCTLLEAGRIWRNTAIGVLFSYVTSLSVQSWHQLGG